MTYNGAVLPTSSPFLPRAHLPCGTVPAYQTRWNTRGAQGQRPSYTPRLQLKDFLSYALGSVAAVLQEGAGEAGALPVDDQLAPRHLNIKAAFREEQSWEKLTQFLCFTEWGLPTHVQL